MSQRSALPGSLDAGVEALLFAAGEGVPVERLARVLGVSLDQLEAGLLMLEERLQDRGIRLQRHGDTVRLVTAAEWSPWVRRLLGLEAQARLSRAALETLAIIAYRQPITRPEIDAIRGVNSEGVLRSLLEKGLIQELGRADAPGRPILYGTTEAFLQHFGLTSLEQLPPLESWEDAA
ncbi:MAG: SMC-Scp complex subunit ScpB [Chloroflexi bacterium]|nr:SMC-Scp complex subunit ScpB [Chloroflexota bacterium]